MLHQAAELELFAAHRPRQPLTAQEREGITVAALSVFWKLGNLYAHVAPIFTRFGFTPPSAGVIARDLSEKIEQAIQQHCPSFTAGRGYADLARGGEEWEVKVCQSSGLTINQSKVIRGEHYIVINYQGQLVRSIWVLWDAAERLFSPRVRNSNARRLQLPAAEPQIDRLFLVGRS